MEKLLALDRNLLHLINEGWRNPFFDHWMPLLRNSPVWMPLYLFLVLFGIFNFKQKSIAWILFAALAVTCTDLVSSNLVKHNIIRLRPCNDPSLASWLQVLVGYRPQSSSFTSSHAANHFGLAIFLYGTLKKHIGRWVLLFFIWAFAISYAQVYVGVHYPGDILGGALIGLFIGYLFTKLFNRYFGL
jgi:undecaprenyl-diphosphatase